MSDSKNNAPKPAAKSGTIPKRPAAWWESRVGKGSSSEEGEDADGMMRIGDRIDVAVRIFGGRAIYEFQVEHVFPAGLAIIETSSQASSNAVPYSLNSLLEVAIDPDKKQLREVVSCVGRIVHRKDFGVNSEDSAAKIVRLVIKLSEIDDKQMPAWKAFASSHDADGSKIEGFIDELAVKPWSKGKQR